jgi:hypothetical protein
MPNQSTKSAVSTSNAIQAQTGLVNHSPLSAQTTLATQTSSVNGLMVYTTSLLLYPTQARDKKNHRMLSMIFFVLGVLVIFRLTHG